MKYFIGYHGKLNELLLWHELYLPCDRHGIWRILLAKYQWSLLLHLLTVNSCRLKMVDAQALALQDARQQLLSEKVCVYLWNRGIVILIFQRYRYGSWISGVHVGMVNFSSPHHFGNCFVRKSGRRWTFNVTFLRILSFVNAEVSHTTPSLHYLWSPNGEKQGAVLTCRQKWDRRQAFSFFSMSVIA